MTFPLMKSSSIEMYSHRQNAGRGEKAAPKYDQVPNHLSAFYEKAVGELKSRGGKSGTEVTNDLAGHIDSGLVTPMAIMAIMNPKTGKYEVMTHDIITPADAAELEMVRQLFMAPKPKRGKKGKKGDDGEETTPPDLSEKMQHVSSTPMKEEPAEEAEEPAPKPKASKPKASKPKPALEVVNSPEPAEPENKGATKMTEMLSEEAEEEEDLDAVLNAATDEPKSEAAVELEAAAEARTEAEEGADDEEDPDLADIFGDDLLAFLLFADKLTLLTKKALKGFLRKVPYAH